MGDGAAPPRDETPDKTPPVEQIPGRAAEQVQTELQQQGAGGSLPLSDGQLTANMNAVTVKGENGQPQMEFNPTIQKLIDSLSVLPGGKPVGLSFRAGQAAAMAAAGMVDAAATTLTEAGQRGQQAGSDGNNAAATPAAGADRGNNATDRTNTSDKIDPASEAGQAKKAFMDEMATRFKNGEISKDEYASLQTQLKEMDRNILQTADVMENGVRRGEDGAQRELAKTYENLLGVANSDKGKVYGEGSGVDSDKAREIANLGVMDAVNKISDYAHGFNQGNQPTCAAEAIDRGMAQVTPASYAKMLNDVANKGEFQIVDPNTGQDRTVKLDMETLRNPDGQAMAHNSFANADSRNMASFWGDIATAQTNLDVNGMIYEQKNADGEVEQIQVPANVAGEPPRLVYRNNRGEGGAGHGDTGEGIYLGDNVASTNGYKGGEFLSSGTSLHSDAMVTTKQAMFGHRLGADYGSATTLVNTSNASDLATKITSGQQLTEQLQQNKAKGWDVASFGMHTGHWSGSEGYGGAGGWHMVSVSANDAGGVDLMNNWGGHFDQTNANANALVATMDNPDGTGGGGGRRVIYDPDNSARVDRPDLNQEKRPEKDEGKKNGKEDEDKNRSDAEKAERLAATSAAMAKIGAAQSHLSAAKTDAEKFDATMELHRAYSELSST